MKAFWPYYRMVNLFNVFFSFIVAFTMLRAYLFPIMFCTAGIAVGFYSYNYFFRNQYYLYHNLGFTRLRLAAIVFVVNLAIALPLLFLTFLF